MTNGMHGRNVWVLSVSSRMIESFNEETDTAQQVFKARF